MESIASGVYNCIMRTRSFLLVDYRPLAIERLIAFS